MADNRPSGRQKHVTGGGNGVNRRGSGLGTGSVGSGSNFTGGQGSPGGNRGSGSRAPLKGGGLSLGTVAVLLVLFLLFRSCGGRSDGYSEVQDTGTVTQGTQTQTTAENQTDTASLLGTLLGGGSVYSSSSSIGGWEDKGYKTGSLDTTVKAGARAKRTAIKGDGTDDNVILIYMCGTDLESKSGMASRDLAEMAAASLNDHVRIFVYTGGCLGWKTSGISNSVNQIYEVADGGLRTVDANRGNGSMVDPNTLIDFLSWAKANTTGNRYDLIFWDHGGGSVSGYGYDEKNSRAGSMNLAGISKALKAGGLSYDFIGFDACLMATVETALTMSDYADYLIASEETEPGVGWYYTTWLTELAKDPGKPTVEVGKIIVDTFTNACAQSASGQKTTLSVTDLAELELTIPDTLKSFASSTSEKINGGDYKTVSDARSGTREFASSSKIDQVDLVHLAMNMGTEEGDALAEAIKSCVKYNQTSQSMTNSYGLSIYFPMRRVSSVDSMVNTAEAIGMDEDYTKMIQEAASMNVYGQAAAGGTGSAYGSLFGGLSSSSSGAGSLESITELLSTFMSSDFSSVAGLNASNTAFLGRGVSIDTAAGTIIENSFPSESLVWQANSDGDQVISLNENAWGLVHELVLNAFYDDGEGFVDLGLDNVFDFDDDGNLLAPTDHTWLSVNSQPVAYYYMDQTDDGEGSTITGRIPAFLNGDRVNLIVSFDDDNPYGAVIGANYDYEEADIDVVAKNLTELEPGDELDFLCDYYTYDGSYSDSYYLGDTLTVPAEGMSGLEISNTDVGDGAMRLLYRFTDIYNESYWTPAIEG